MGATASARAATVVRFAVLLAATPLAAQQIIQPNFGTTSGLTLNSAATANSTVTGEGRVLRLASSSSNDRGSAFTTSRINVANGFSTTFSFRISSPGGTTDNTGDRGADGLAFVLQRTGATALGASGEGLGYQGIAKSAAFEFDTFRNPNRGDPSSNHVGFNTGGSITSVATAHVPTDFDNGAKWTAWVDYNGATLELRLSTNGLRPATPTLTRKVDLEDTLDGDTAHVGFTAGTGLATGVHDLLSWALLGSYSASGITMFTWSGTGLWSDTARWNPGAVPGSSDIAFLSSGAATVADARSLGSLQLGGATLSGAGTLSLTGGNSTWSSGGLAGNVTLSVLPGAALTVSGTAHKDFHHGDSGVTTGPTLSNQGTLLWTGGTLASGGNARLLNQFGGTFTTTFDGTFAHASGTSRPVFNNAGTFTKRESEGVTEIQATFDNTGAVAIDSGILQLSGGGTNSGSIAVAAGAALHITHDYTIANAAQVTGAGSLLLTSGSLSLTGRLDLANFTQTGGQLTGSQTFGGTAAWVGGDWNPGAGGATTRIAGGALLLIGGSGNRNFNFRTIENAVDGTVLWTSGTLRSGNGGAFINHGTFIDLNSGPASMESPNANNGFGGAFTFTNTGTYDKSGPGTTEVNIPFVNTGTIILNGGTLRFNQGFDNSGSFALGRNANAVFTTPISFAASTPLTGSGTIDAPLVTAAGVVAPGSSPGSLTLTGDLTLLATSSLLMELAGLGQGSDYDFLGVGGTAALAGQLAVTFLDEFQFQLPAGASFTILTAQGGLTGAFANVLNGQRLTTTDGWATFQVNYGTGSPFAANSVVLSHFVVAVPEPSTYVLMALGSVVLLLRFRRRSN
jgi:hypothetical protein